MTKVQTTFLALSALVLGGAGGWIVAQKVVSPPLPVHPLPASVEADGPGNSAPDESAASDEWLRDARKATMPQYRHFVLPLNNPDVVPAHEADHMLPHDIVVGLVIGSHARAYPWWILANYHVVNDTIQGSTTPVFVALCERCSGAAAFHPVVEQRPLIFQVSGMGMGTFEVADVQTLSTWHPFAGKAEDGPLSGTTLRRIPVVLERWNNWKEAHPDTDVVYGSYQMRLRDHGRLGGTVGHPNRIYMKSNPRDLNLVDDRLPTNEMVYGLLGSDQNSGIAVPLRELMQTDLLELTFESTPVILFLRGEYRTFGFERVFQGETLTFEPHAQDPFQIRDQAGTVWNEWGQAVEGPHTGGQLTPAHGYVTEWYEWCTLIPASAIYSDRLKTPLLRSTSELAAEADSLLKQGMVFKQQYNWEQAANMYRQAIRVQPDLVLAHFNLGAVRVQQRQLTDAARHLERAVELQPGFAEGHAGLARVKLSLNDREGARAHFLRAIEIDPDYEDGHRGLAVMLTEDGKLDEAAASLERVVQILPVDTSIRVFLGQTLEQLGDLKRAAEQYRHALRIDPDSLDGHLAMGRVQRKLGDLPAAVVHYRRALQQNSELADTANGLSWIIATSDDGSLGEAAEAVKWAEHAVKLTEHRNPGILDTLAAAYAHAGRFEDAIVTVEKALALARESGNEKLSSELQQHLELYKSDRPYRTNRE